MPIESSLRLRRRIEELKAEFAACQDVDEMRDAFRLLAEVALGIVDFSIAASEDCEQSLEKLDRSFSEVEDKVVMVPAELLSYFASSAKQFANAVSQFRPDGQIPAKLVAEHSGRHSRMAQLLTKSAMPAQHPLASPD